MIYLDCRTNPQKWEEIHTRKLNNRIARIGKNSPKAMAKVGRFIVEKSKELTPVATGRLRNSFVINVIPSKNGAGLLVGNTAPYATIVHEDLNAPRRSGQAKFVSAAVYRHTRDITKILMKEMRK